MICSECGKLNAEDAMFCTECGAKLNGDKSNSYSCPHCGYKTTADAHFCPNCGQAIAMRNFARKKKKSAKKWQPSSRRALKQNDNQRFLFVIFFAVLILTIIGVRSFYKTTSTPTTQTPQPLVMNPALQAKVMEVAEKFRCSCGQCGGTPLESCSCNTAREEKELIARNLQSGKSMAQVVGLVNSRYGWLKPEYENEFGQKNK